ncbi:MAG: thioredoxin [Ancalomicrobiaceae bacterium]|nr:thioredoxin [Ancalomicrobiaceae bacterium]
MTGPSFSFGNSYSGAAQPAQPAKPAPAAAPAAFAPAVSTNDLIKETTTRDFLKDVIETSKQVPVLVDFWADWCGPCKQLTPILEKVVTNAKGKVRLVKMNIDKYPEVAGQLGVRSIPAVFAFKGGQPVDGFMGAVPESQVQQFIERLAGPVGPSDAEAMIEEGRLALAEGDLEGAAQLFGAALQMEPESVPAIVGLADVFVAAKEYTEARAILAKLPAGKDADPLVAGVKARIDLEEQSAKLGDPVAFEARIAHDANDHEARFGLALILNAHGDREAAIDHLVEIVRRKRDWNEEAARKQLVQFFEAWGPKDEMTLYGRRRLSSVLFA